MAKTKTKESNQTPHESTSFSVDGVAQYSEENGSRVYSTHWSTFTQDTGCPQHWLRRVNLNHKMLSDGGYLWEKENLSGKHVRVTMDRDFVKDQIKQLIMYPLSKDEDGKDQIPPDELYDVLSQLFSEAFDHFRDEYHDKRRQEADEAIRQIANAKGVSEKEVREQLGF